MNDRLTQKLAGTIASQLDAATVDPDAADDLGSFGLLRGVRERAQMLVLRRASGDQLAVSYACIDRIEFNPSENRITLHGVGKEIRIRGRHLATAVRGEVSLFEVLARHRVPWVREAGQCEQLTVATGSCVILSIDW